MGFLGMDIKKSSTSWTQNTTTNTDSNNQTFSSARTFDNVGNTSISLNSPASAATADTSKTIMLAIAGVLLLGGLALVLSGKGGFK